MLRRLLVLSYVRQPRRQFLHMFLPLLLLLSLDGRPPWGSQLILLAGWTLQVVRPTDTGHRPEPVESKAAVQLPLTFFTIGLGKGAAAVFVCVRSLSLNQPRKRRRQLLFLFFPRLLLLFLAARQLVERGSLRE